MGNYIYTKRRTFVNALGDHGYVSYKMKHPTQTRDIRVICVNWILLVYKFICVQFTLVHD